MFLYRFVRRRRPLAQGKGNVKQFSIHVLYVEEKYPKEQSI